MWTGHIVSGVKDGAGLMGMATDTAFTEYLRATGKVEGSQVIEVIM